MEFLDRRDHEGKGATFDEIVRNTGLSAELLRANLQDLVQAGILYSRRTSRGHLYGLAD